MKKLTLLFAILLAAGAQAQTYFEDDFSDGLIDWTLVDADGDTFNWVIADYGTGDGQGNVAASASWDSGAGILNPDNFMIAGPIDLTGATGEVFVTWKVKAQDQSYADENYTVYAATGSGVVDLMASPINFTEVVGTTGGNYVTRSLNISDVVGEAEVYIAFRHHDVSDEFRLNVDDVNVLTLPEYELEMVANTTYPLIAPGVTAITGTVKNNGYATITSFDLDWNDGAPHSSTITATIAPGGSYNFSHPIELSAEAGVVYNMSICLTLSGDADETNNCVDAVVTCADEFPDKYVVGEERTGTWCGWCPRGAVALEGMESEDKFIGIAVHNGDPMAISSYDSGISAYIPSSFPTGAVDRVIVGNPADFSSMFNTRITMIPFASVDVSFVEVGANIEVTVSANFAAELSGDYRLAAVITQDRVTGTGSGYNQVNYYSGGGAGAMGGYEDLPDPVPAADMVYDHVAVALGNNEVLGEAGSLPTDIGAGTTESFTYTFAKDADWNMDWLHFVGMLVDGTTGEIINAGTTQPEFSGIEEELVSNFNISLYPNPASETARIRLDLEEVSNVTVEIFNNLGEVVFSNSTQNLNAGAYFYNVDVQDFAAGIYTVRTTADNAVKTLKLSVQ